jgi:hypothetical protein
MPEVRDVFFPPEVVEKLWSAHGLTQWEVEEVIFDPESDPRWDVDPTHGGRVILRGRTRAPNSRIVFVALRLIDLDRGAWACITAFVPTDQTYGE